MQHDAFDPKFVISYIEATSKEPINSIKKIDYEMLEEIFEYPEYFYLEDILDRRDQVIEHFASQMGFTYINLMVYLQVKAF